jgi:hypothetical protein
VTRAARQNADRAKRLKSACAGCNTAGSIVNEKQRRVCRLRERDRGALAGAEPSRKRPRRRDRTAFKPGRRGREPCPHDGRCRTLLNSAATISGINTRSNKRGGSTLAWIKTR